MEVDETKAADAADSPAAEQVITSYKGFGQDWKCRDFQFEVGGTYSCEGAVKACGGGFHACENPLDVFLYYTPGESRFAVVEQSGAISRHFKDSKIASQHISIKAELSIPGLISAALEYVKSKCSPDASEHATGARSASSATGARSASSATGDSSASSATGYSSASSATGYSSASSATGARSASSATGDSSASSATGARSASSATGDSSASSATGYSSASSATGYSSASSATGARSASLTTGNYSASEIKPADDGKPLHASAISTGYEGCARAPEGCALMLVERSEKGEILNAWAGVVGRDGIKPGVWYRLCDGKPVEVQQ